eukprot:759586-Hanusia_phi.AAC.1
MSCRGSCRFRWWRRRRVRKCSEGREVAGKKARQHSLHHSWQNRRQRGCSFRFRLFDHFFFSSSSSPPPRSHLLLLFNPLFLPFSFPPFLLSSPPTALDSLFLLTSRLDLHIEDSGTNKEAEHAVSISLASFPTTDSMVEKKFAEGASKTARELGGKVRGRFARFFLTGSCSGAC